MCMCMKFHQGTTAPCGGSPRSWWEQFQDTAGVLEAGYTSAAVPQQCAVARAAARLLAAASAEAAVESELEVHAGHYEALPSGHLRGYWQVCLAGHRFVVRQRDGQMLYILAVVPQKRSWSGLSSPCLHKRNSLLGLNLMQ